MGNRSKYLAVTAAMTGGALALRRRLRLRQAADGIRDAILPTHVPDLPSDREPQADEAHAPGHQHLAPGDLDEQGPEPLRGRPWARRVNNSIER